MELQNQSINEINAKIEYWVDVWNDLIAHFTKTHYGLELISPHVALIVLIDEIEHNELRSKETRQYLLETIAGFLKHDPVTQPDGTAYSIAHMAKRQETSGQARTQTICG